MKGRGKPSGRIDAGTMSLDEVVKETISVDDTLPADSEHRGDFPELREVPRTNYVIGDEISRGGMGVILDARDRRTGRRLAIKEVRADVMARDPAAVRAAVLRFRREAVLTAQLQHPSIVPVHEIGRFGQVPFIAMKRVSGRPLDELIDEAESERDRLALLPRLGAVADAIAYAHSQGVVHRDIKPANVIVGEFGETIVIDWGLAKIEGASDEELPELGVAGDMQTVAGAVFGTPQYMPPEQAAGSNAGAPSDVYSLGAILYELLTGETPYTSVLEPGATAADIIAHVTAAAPPAISELNPRAPADLVSIANKAMARDAGDRYSSAGEMASDIRAYERGQLVDVHDYSVIELMRRWVGRHKALVVVALALLFVGAASTTWFVLQTMAARDDAETQEKRATAELRKAMELIRDRGFAERRTGNLQRAALSLATAYQHIDDYSLRVALGELMRGIDPQVRVLHRQVGKNVVVSVDTVNRRIAVEVGDLTRVVALSGETVFEVDGIHGMFADSGEYLITYRDRALSVYGKDGALQRTVPLLDLGSWMTSEHGDLLVLKGAMGEAFGYSLRTGEQLFHYNHPGAPLLGEVAVSDKGDVIVFMHDGVKAVTREGVVSDLFSVPPSGVTQMSLPSAVSPDGTIAATSAQPGQIDLVRLKDVKQRRRLRAQNREIISLRIANDNRTVVSMDRDGGICFVDVASKKPSCATDANAMTFSVGDDAVAVGQKNGTVTIWDFKGRLLREFAAHSEGFNTYGRLVSKDELITVGHDGLVRLWDTKSPVGETVVDANKGESIQLAIPYIVHRRAHDATFWRVGDQQRKTTIACAKSHVSAMAGGGVIACGGSLWTEDGQESKRPQLDTASTAALDGAGKFLATAYQRGTVKVSATSSAEILWTREMERFESDKLEYMYRPLKFSADGSKLVVGTVGKSVVFDAATGALLAELVYPDPGSNGTGFNFIRGGSRIVVNLGTSLLLFEASGRLVKRVRSPDLVTVSLADGSGVVVGSFNRIGLFGMTDSGGINWFGSGEQTRTRVANLGVSERGLVAAATLGGRIYLFDTEGRLISTRVADSIRYFGFHSDWLVSAGHNQALVSSTAAETRPPAEVNAIVESLVSTGQQTKTAEDDVPGDSRARSSD